MTVAGLDVAEVPPPLPLKGTSTDYGTLTENLDLTGSPTPPPREKTLKFSPLCERFARDAGGKDPSTPDPDGP